MTFRLGVDVGGTFTDVILIDGATGDISRSKVPSTPADPGEGVLAGVSAVCESAGVDPSSIRAFMHGTTVATNAILERDGARVGLLVSDGYRQVLHIGRSYVPGGLGGWIIWPTPEPLVDLEDTREVGGRLAADGTEILPLDEAGVRDALRSLRSAGVESLTVSLMHSYVDDSHERRVAELVLDEFPGVSVSLSSQILPEIREYERTVTTVANAYVQPTVGRYLRKLRDELERLGVAGEPRVLRSDGGLMAFSAAEGAPVNLLLSGPAGGVSGAMWMARLAGFENVLTLDMGGTSTDVALIEDGIPRIERQTSVGDIDVRVPSVDVRTVGAGGGSIAHVPELTRALRVGPMSAGAVPGPAAYGRGGTRPTVTDANVVLGYLPESLLGGSMALDVEAARRAVATVAEALGLTVEAAAEGIVDIVNEHMFGALRLVSVQQGYDPRDFALVAFGGAGPLHANALATLLGSWPVIIPPSPGLLCAFGAATTRPRGERSRTFIREVGPSDRAQVQADVGHALEELAAEAGAALAAEGVAAVHQETRYQIDVRYRGQAFEVTIDLEPDEFAGLGVAGVLDRFDAEHERLFSFALDADHELVNLRSIVEGPASDVSFGGMASEASRTPATIGKSPARMGGAVLEATIYDRAGLREGDRLEGPAIITELDSTTLVLAGHVAVVDAFGNLLIRPEERRV